ncbi:MAG: hypothetical protein JWN67_2329 [Actinomycetia bacterium]|nr:hypothetical protein [Actinomycetes bacterium]
MEDVTVSGRWTTRQSIEEGHVMSRSSRISAVTVQSKGRANAASTSRSTTRLA